MPENRYALPASQRNKALMKGKGPLKAGDMSAPKVEMPKMPKAPKAKKAKKGY